MLNFHVKGHAGHLALEMEKALRLLHMFVRFGDAQGQVGACETLMDVLRGSEDLRAAVLNGGALPSLVVMLQADRPEGWRAAAELLAELLRLVMLLLRRHWVDQTQSTRDDNGDPNNEGNGGDEYDADPYSAVAGEACALALVLLRELDSVDVAGLREIVASGTASGAAADEAGVAALHELEAVIRNCMGYMSDVATQQRLVRLLARPSTHWNVQAGALRLLAWTHSRRVRLLGRLGRLRLADTDTAHLHARVAPRLASLRAATATVGRWHFLCEPDHYETLQAARGILRDLAGVAGGGMAAQSVLVESGAVAALMQAVMLPATAASHGPAELSQHAQLVAIARLACRALVALCRGCERAQTELFAQLTRLSTPSWLDQPALELLEALSDGRVDLCARMPDPLLRALGAAALGPTRSVTHARVLARLMVAQGVPIRRVQRRVLIHAASMPAAFTLPEAGTRAADEAGLLARFELLTACAVGRHLEAQTKCQQFCPLHALASALPGSPPPLQLAIARLLHAAFIDTETSTPGLKTSQGFLRVLSHFKVEIDELAGAQAEGPCRTSASEQALDEKRNVIYDGVLPCLLSYLRGVALSARGTVARLPVGQHATGLGLSSALLALYRTEVPACLHFCDHRTFTAHGSSPGRPCSRHCVLGLKEFPPTARQAHSAMRRLAIGRVLHAMRQLGLPPSQFDASHLTGLEATAEQEAKQASAIQEHDSVWRSRPALPPLALEEQVALGAGRLSVHAPAAVAVRDDATTLVEELIKQGDGAAAGLLRLMMALTQQREQDGRLCVCVLRLLRRVEPYASGGIELGAKVALLLQLIEGVAWTAVKAASSSEVHDGGQTDKLHLEDAWGSDARRAEPLDIVLELEGLQLVIEALEADSAGTLRSRITSTLQARPRRAVACRQAMAKRLQRGVAAARTLGDYGRPQLQQHELEVGDLVVMAGVASSQPDEASQGSTKPAGGLLASDASNLRGLELTLRLVLLLYAEGRGPRGSALSPSGAAAGHPAETEMLPPLANLVSFPAQRQLSSELAELCILGLQALAAMASEQCGRERRTFLGSSVLASCSWLQRQSHIMGIDARTIVRLRDAATLVLAIIQGLQPALLLAAKPCEMHESMLRQQSPESMIALWVRDVLVGGRQLVVLVVNGALLRNDQGTSWLCAFYVAWAFAAATLEGISTVNDNSWTAGMPEFSISRGPRQERLQRSITFVITGALGLVSPWFFVLMLLASEMPGVGRSLAMICPRAFLMLLPNCCCARS